MLDQALTQARVAAGASDLHGSMCGFLCAGGSIDGDWMAALAISEEEAQGAARQLLEALLGYCVHQLDDPQMSFQPLLPTDTRPLSTRVEALASWCQGFLGGYGVAAAEAAPDEDAREVLTDLAGIAEAQFEFDEAPDEDENAYAELLEYVRVGVLFLRGEQPLPVSAPLPGPGRVH